MYIRKKANELREMFEVYANFYSRNIEGIGEVNCRNVADVLKRGTELDKDVDAYIVMMNPGSCKPNLDSITKNKTLKLNWVSAKEDPAQRQVMNLMILQNWSHVRILNLSDMISGDSSEHRNKLLNMINNEHSIFDQSRIEELNELMKVKAPVILSWGKEESQKELAKNAKNYLRQFQCIGLEYDKEHFFYKYIKPRNWSDCDKIVSDLNDLINSKI